MQRITNAMIERALEDLNAALGRPLEAHSKDSEGRYRSNVGNFHMGQAYGGHRLEEMQNTAGGIRAYGGYGTKRELLDRIDQMVEGIHMARRNS